MNEQIVERMEALRAEAMDCRKCGLCETRSNVVFGEGNPDTPMVIIGEGPGANEDATGRPFVGRAGTLLDECLRENGITRKHVFICNIVKCRPAIFENGRSRNRQPSTEEQVTCTYWLDRQLEIIKPKVILCLGAVAANYIIHTNFRMTIERGKWFECRYANHATAALHPAYVLRQAGQGLEASRSSLVQDIAEARRKVIELKKEQVEPPPALF